MTNDTPSTDGLGPKRAKALELTNNLEIGTDTIKLANAMGITRNAAAGHIRGLRESGHLPPSTRRRRRSAPAVATPSATAAGPPTPPPADGSEPPIDSIAVQVDEERGRFLAAHEARKTQLQALVEHHRAEQARHAAEASKAEALLKQVDAEIKAVTHVS